MSVYNMLYCYISNAHTLCYLWNVAWQLCQKKYTVKAECVVCSVLCNVGTGNRTDQHEANLFPQTKVLWFPKVRKAQITVGYSDVGCHPCYSQCVRYR